jgi:penicillin-binding protein 1A
MSRIQWIKDDDHPRARRFNRWAWRIFFLGIVSVCVWFVYLSRQDLPTFEDLENPSNKQASQVFDRNGGTLGRYYVENRVPVSFDELSPNLVQALIATEDIRFYQHSGIDFRALGRVIFKTVFLGQAGSGGGSTITQQLAKLLYSNRDFRGMGNVRKTLALVTIKMKEWITAVKLERSYTKEEILSMYLNHFDFINGAHGIRAASEIYFSKTPGELEIEEAAMLVGMLQNPNLYNPLRRPEMTRQRRDVVMRQMARNKYISRGQLDSLVALPLDMTRFRRFSHDEGLAPYFRMELRKEIQRLLELPECRKPNGEKYDIFRDGLRIYTTLDTVIQHELEGSVANHMPGLQKKFWNVWRGRDPWTHRDRDITDTELAARKNALQRQVREMERYLILRADLLEPFVERHSLSVGRFSLRDHDITRMIEEEKQAGTLQELLKARLITADMLADYKKIMRASYWSELKTTWEAFQKEVEAMLKTPVKMVVFDYTAPNFTRDTVMTPMDSLRYHRMILQTGAIAIDPANGHILAWVGGVNYRHFQYDHVTSSRQVGSTFKPFVYATAVALQSISPCMKLQDLPQTIIPGEGNFRLIQEWTPKNFDEYTGESMTLFEGLRKSKNTFSVYLMKQLGDTEPVRGLIHNMGIDSSARLSNGQYRVPRQPSIALGAADLTVLEMTGAYSTFANDGVYNKPVMITRIEDAYGRLIYQDIPLERRALSAESNFVMVEMLRQASRGAGGFGGIVSEFGGKTGTTNLHSDGWYMGITPGLVVGVWVGGEDRWIRFTNPADGQGSVMARPIFSDLLRRLEQHPNAPYNKEARFHRPAAMRIQLDCGQYQQGYGEEVPFDDSDMYEDIFN